jgi:hypothetical protein
MESKRILSTVILTLHSSTELPADSGVQKGNVAVADKKVQEEKKCAC